jgi:enamine deaminase RidA (YjgF/YER057c/UK114 family)
VELWDGAPYEYARSANGIVFAAGACPLDENGVVVAPGDHEAQAARCVDNLLLAVGDAELLKTTVYVVGAERADLVRVWNVVEARLGRVPSTLLGVSLLGYPDQLVELEAVAFTRSQQTGD